MIYGPKSAGSSYVTTCAENNLQRSQATGPNECQIRIIIVKRNDNVLPEPSGVPS